MSLLSGAAPPRRPVPPRATAFGCFALSTNPAIVITTHWAYGELRNATAAAASAAAAAAASSDAADDAADGAPRPTDTNASSAPAFPPPVAPGASSPAALGAPNASSSGGGASEADAAARRATADGAGSAADEDDEVVRVYVGLRSIVLVKVCVVAIAPPSPAAARGRTVAPYITGGMQRE
jgi:hypothetical protein